MIEIKSPGSWRRAGASGAYVCALLALGLWGLRPAWSQSQGVVPVDVAGPGRASPAAASPQIGAPAAVPGATGALTPAAAPIAAPAPTATPVAAAMPGGAATQGVVPVDVATQPKPETPTAGTPATPATSPTVSVPATPAPAAGTPAATPPATAAATTPPATPATVPATATVAPPTSEPTVAVNPGQAIPKDGKAYPVTEIKIGYKFQHAGQPAIGELMDSEIKLGVVEDGYVAPRPGVPVVSIKLGDIGKSGPQKLYHSGIAAIYSHVLRLFSARSIIGVFVVVDSADIKMDPANPDKDEDVRNGARTSLQFVVVTSVVKAVRTVEIGEASAADRVNNPRDEFIRDRSPLQPAAEGAPVQNDLLRKDVLDDYVLRLNRFQGRRVDVAISGTDTPGELNLDYLVSQSRSWYAFAQVSNTGTSQTANIGERFGYVNSELTGHDDILSLDYSTASFSKSHAIDAYYDVPFMNLDGVRNRVLGSWSEYTASDVGQNNEKFTGTGWTAGDELSMNFYQHRELFIDAVAGFKMQESQTNNSTAATNGLGLFEEPYLGLKLERLTDISTTTGLVTLIAYLSGTDLKELEGLGRAAPTRSPVVVQYDFAQSFYLEPLLDPQKFSQGGSTLAHELYFSLRGQYAFNSRLFPQAQDVAGGLFSVRGYPESIAAGDTVVLGTAEYRFHVPRLFGVNSDPTKTPFLWENSFRFAPQTVYGRPDWDLILRGFVDAGQVNISSRQSFEANQTLVGTGIGMELQIKQNFNLRLDWGVPLTELNNEVRAGASRVHLSATLLY